MAVTLLPVIGLTHWPMEIGEDRARLTECNKVHQNTTGYPATLHFARQRLSRGDRNETGPLGSDSLPKNPEKLRKRDGMPQS